MTRAGGTTAPARVLRGGLVGLVSGAGAVIAHQLTGGHASASVAVAVTAVSVLLGVGLARWRVGVPTALGLALVAQATAHLLMAGAGGHVHGSMAHRADLGGQTHDAWPMLAAHAAVAVATALLSRRADQVVLDLLRTLVGWFVPRTRPALLPLPARRLAHLLDVRLLPSGRVVLAPLWRRGPPVRCARPLTSP